MPSRVETRGDSVLLEGPAFAFTRRTVGDNGEATRLNSYDIEEMEMNLFENIIPTLLFVALGLLCLAIPAGVIGKLANYFPAEKAFMFLMAGVIVLFLVSLVLIGVHCFIEAFRGWGE